MIQDALRQALAERYSIERELGAGGMATVYLAQDRRHERPVAIKVLRPDLAAALGAERFSREIRVLARLRHPFILPLHDSGVAAGSLYYVMSYVDGESLGDRLRRVGRLSVREAVKITREIADALTYAHAEGVVHRDVKPENILLSRQGHALLADFGIARGRLTIGDGKANVTAMGLTVGTPAYMSPEQAFGDAGVDGRSDIYSLAITLYEMLAGRPPFDPSSSVAVAIQHLTAPVPALSSVGADVPRAIEAALTRALAKEPDGRFATAGEFAAALEAPDTTAATIVAPSAPPPLTSIVVLPLANVSGDKDNDYLSDGITEELIGALARVGGLRVISRTSAFAFKGKSLPISEIGSQLNVSFALEGGVRRSGDRLRVTAQLIRVSDDSSLWSESYERQLADVFAVQDDIAQRIVSTLTRTLKLTPVATPEPMAKPESVEAYHHYLLGRYHWYKRTETGLRQALDLFEKAVLVDPGYAPAHSGVADATSLLASNGYTPVETFATAAAAARRAIELDPSLAEGHASLGFIKLHAEWDWAGAESEFRRAIAINPSYVPASQWLSAFLAATGRFDEGLHLAERAVHVDPLSILARVNLGMIYFYGGRTENALTEFRQAVAMEPRFESALTWVAISAAMLGYEEEAISHAQAAADLEPEERADGTFAAIYALLGRRAEAEASLARTLESPSVYPLFIAMIYALLGNDEETFAWLERSYEARSDWIYSIGGQPVFAHLRGDPRFHALIDRLGLPRLEPVARV